MNIKEKIIEEVFLSLGVIPEEDNSDLNWFIDSIFEYDEEELIEVLTVINFEGRLIKHIMEDVL